ncbi:MAG: toluene monooxygenase [Actinomycetota bacterium]|jgi:toluene monooxygenase system protein B|nr:toluene monooxygenase [Actinomycetota bacterium]
MALFPLQGCVEGDFVVLLVPVDDGDTMSVVGEKVRAHVLGRRLPEDAGPWRVRVGGAVLDDEVTVSGAGLAPLDAVEVVRA